MLNINIQKIPDGPAKEAIRALANALAPIEGGSLKPGRSLFVAKSWPTGADPDIFFTTIPAALAKAATLPRTNLDMVSVFVFPGVYTEPFELISNVAIVGYDRINTSITGAITWNPGAGANTPTANDPEFVSMRDVWMQANLTVDGTGKASNGSVIKIERFLMTGMTFSHTSRAAGEDQYVLLDGLQLFASTVSVSSFAAIFVTILGNVTLTDVGTFETRYSDYNQLTLNGATNGKMNACKVNMSTTVNGTSTLIARASQLADVNVAAGASADIRGSTYTSLVGPGPIDRSLDRMSFGPTGVGANPVPFAVPYVSAGYDVMVTENAGPGGAPTVTVTGKTPAGFVLNDPAGGRTFDLATLLV